MGSSARTTEEKEIAREVTDRRKANGFYLCPHRIILNSVRSSGFGYFQHNYIRGPKNVTDQGAQGYSAEPDIGEVGGIEERG